MWCSVRNQQIHSRFTLSIFLYLGFGLAASSQNCSWQSLGQIHPMWKGGQCPSTMPTPAIQSSSHSFCPKNLPMCRECRSWHVSPRRSFIEFGVLITRFFFFAHQQTFHTPINHNPLTPHAHRSLSWREGPECVKSHSPLLPGLLAAKKKMIDRSTKNNPSLHPLFWRSISGFTRTRTDRKWWCWRLVTRIATRQPRHETTPQFRRLTNTAVFALFHKDDATLALRAILLFRRVNWKL